MEVLRPKMIAILIAQLFIFIVCASISAQDTQPPVGKVDINKEQKVVTSRFVTLKIEANDENGIKKMCISNTETCTSWQDYMREIIWVLSEGNGLKTVHVYVLDNAGNIGHTTDYIRLEE
jgi:hypothetical protein